MVSLSLSKHNKKQDNTHIALPWIRNFHNKSVACARQAEPTPEAPPARGGAEDEALYNVKH